MGCQFFENVDFFWTTLPLRPVATLWLPPPPPRINLMSSHLLPFKDERKGSAVTTGSGFPQEIGEPPQSHCQSSWPRARQWLPPSHT